MTLKEMKDEVRWWWYYSRWSPEYWYRNASHYFHNLAGHAHYLRCENYRPGQWYDLDSRIEIALLTAVADYVEIEVASIGEIGFGGLTSMEVLDRWIGDSPKGDIMQELKEVYLWYRYDYPVWMTRFEHATVSEYEYIAKEYHKELNENLHKIVEFRGVMWT